MTRRLPPGTPVAYYPGDGHRPEAHWHGIVLFHHDNGVGGLLGLTDIECTDPHPEPLLAYLTQREAARADAVAAVLDSLTDRERGLVHDAAVMGYVQGLMRDRAEGCPKDSLVMALVVDACLAFPDLYPTITADLEDHRQTVEYFVQCQQPDESWEQASSTTTDPEFAVERLAAKRRMMPDFEYRIARRTTTVVVEVARPS